MISNSERYLRAAAACRKKAKTAAHPAEWLGFAADWERMAEQADWLSNQRAAAEVVLRESFLQPAPMGQRPTLH